MENQLTPLQQAAVGRKLIEAEIIARAWSDDSFRVKLESDPVAALKEAGFPVPEGKTIRVVREEPGVLQIALPTTPSSSNEAGEAELETVAGGGSISSGKCQSWESAKNSDGVTKFFTGFALGIAGAFGGSWGWG